jgi:hypothetical protein
MTNADVTVLAIRMLLTQVPVILIAAIGLWFAASRRARLGRVSTWATWGFGLLIVNAIVGVAIQLALMVVRMEARASSAGDVASTVSSISLWSLVNYPVFLVSIALLTRAVFLDRETQARREY